jgi:hypothetical protein
MEDCFRTRYGHFEYTVTSFDLRNAPAVFQHMANDIFRDFLDIFLIVHLDDILIYLKTPEDHQMHVRQALQRLREYGLYAAVARIWRSVASTRIKCNFWPRGIYSPQVALYGSDTGLNSVGLENTTISARCTMFFRVRKYYKGNVSLLRDLPQQLFCKTAEKVVANSQ